MTSTATATAPSFTTLFQWSDSYSIGLQEVDEQHRVLVDLLNELHDAVHHHKGSQKCREVLDRLGCSTTPTSRTTSIGTRS